MKEKIIINLDKIQKTDSMSPTPFLANFFAFYNKSELPKAITLLASSKLTLRLAENLARSYNTQHPVYLQYFDTVQESLEYLQPFIVTYFKQLLFQYKPLTLSQVNSCQLKVIARFTQGIWKRLSIPTEDICRFILEETLVVWRQENENELMVGLEVD